MLLLWHSVGTHAVCISTRYWTRYCYYQALQSNHSCVCSFCHQRPFFYTFLQPITANLLWLNIRCKWSTPAQLEPIQSVVWRSAIFYPLDSSVSEWMLLRKQKKMQKRTCTGLRSALVLVLFVLLPNCKLWCGKKMSTEVCGSFVLVRVCACIHARVSGICRRGRAGRPPQAVWALLGLCRLTGRYVVGRDVMPFPLRDMPIPRNSFLTHTHTHPPSLPIHLHSSLHVEHACPWLTSVSQSVFCSC